MRRLATTLLLGALCAVAPAAAAQQPLPAPSYPAVASQEAMVPMDDGVRLGVTLYMPSAGGNTPAPGPFPVVLSMTPYGRTNPAFSSKAVAEIFARRGIAFAEADIRGAGGSEGTLADNYFSPREARDGKLLVDWLGTRPWSTGKVGMTGGSYVGITQYLTAARKPQHLVAITPSVALADLYRDAWTHGGAVSMFFGLQYLAVQGLPGALGINTDPALLPTTIKAKLGQQLPGLIAFDFLKRPDDDAFFRERSPINYADEIEVPALILGGWRDGFIRGTAEMYQALARRPGVITRLSVGPCTHKGCGAPFAPTLDGTGVDSPLNDAFLFLDHFLRGAPLPAADPVRYFVQGARRYEGSTAWPPAESTERRLHLAPGGGLTDTAPADPSQQSFLANPLDGLSLALNTHGTVAISPYVPLDQRLETGRGLTWRTPVLDRPLTLAGPSALRLNASSSADDTDWYAKLSDVAPDGTESIITEGALRASHRELDPARSTPARPFHTHTNPTRLVPRRTYGFDVEVWPTAYELAAGHRLQLRLTSSDLPTHLPARFALDPLKHFALRWNPLALNTVTLGGPDPSSLLLTVLPG